MANFETAVNLVLDFEKGYQALRGDSGNYNSLGQLVGTKCGISAPIYEIWLKRIPTVADMKAITPAIAKRIYKAYFWDAYKIGNIKDQFIANHIFDMFVNMAPRYAADIVQDSINAIIPNRVVNDKAIGNLTIAAINEITDSGKAAELNTELYKYQIIQYRNFGGEYLESWLSRADLFKNYTTSVIAANPSSSILTVVILVGIGFLLFGKA